MLCNTGRQRVTAAGPIQKEAVMGRQLLVRADDLGFSRGVNYGIADAVDSGIIRSVGLMPNMPDAEHGVRLLAGKDICFGLHTNICVGRPLTPAARIPSLCGENGDFKTSKEYRAAYQAGTDFVVLEEVVEEIEAQYQRFVALTGREPGYFEGHAVASDNFFKGLEIVAKRHNAPYLPVDLASPVDFCGHKLRFVMEPGLPNYHPFETMKKAVMDTPEDAIPMLVYHPGYLDAYLMGVSSLTLPRTWEVETVRDPNTMEWLQEQDVQLITYDDLNR